MEGKNGEHVGQVKAIDADEGHNAVVYYSLPDDVPFIIDVNSGDIRTSTELDYEKQSVSNEFRSNCEQISLESYGYSLHASMFPFLISSLMPYILIFTNRSTSSWLQPKTERRIRD